MTHQILYIPGFGGERDANIQIKALKKWQKLDVEVHFMPIDWADGEPFESKLERTIKQIEELYGRYGKISLVGVSAGASLAINAYVEMRDAVSGVVFICGKLRNPEGVNERYFAGHPAFRKSVFAGGANVENLTKQDKAKMLTLRSLFDGLIPAHDSRIPGVKKKFIPMVTHAPTIFLAITIYKRIAVNFLKRRAE